MAYPAKAFEKLSPVAKVVHTASVLLIALSMILLVAPAPYRRVAQDGEHTERFDRVGVRFVFNALCGCLPFVPPSTRRQRGNPRWCLCVQQSSAPRLAETPR